MRLRTTLLTIVFLVWFTSPSFSTPSDNSINAVLGDRSWSFEHSTPPPVDEVLRIRTHLEFVQTLLWQADTFHLSPAQRARRAAALRHLGAYTDAGVFPRRDAADGFWGRRPQFIDARGVHCAVGELIRHSGAASLATAIDGQWEYAYVEEIESAELSAWAEHHGFTALELAMIQPTYQPQTTADTVEADVKRITDGLIIRCGAKQPEVPRRLTVRVNGDEAGHITVIATSTATPFSKCFVSGLQTALNGMRKIVATPFTRELALELPTPQALAQQRLVAVASERCTRLSGPRPTHVSLRMKSGDGKVEFFAETTPKNEKIDACVQTDFRRVFHGFLHGKWAFAVSATREVQPIVDAGRLKMGLENVVPLAASSCDGAKQNFTVEAAIKKGDTKVDIAVKGGSPKFRACAEQMITEIITNFMLRTTSLEVLDSDADIHLSYTYDPGPLRAGD